jgi:hypothetical protein
LLCLAAAIVFRISLPALQVMNHLSSPLQLALMIPLARMGARVVAVPASRSLGTWSLGTIALQAIAGWLFLCVPLGFALYFPLLYALRQRRSSQCASAAVGWFPSGS